MTLVDELETLVDELDALDLGSSVVPVKKVPYGDVFEASRAGDVERLRYLLEAGVNVNARDQWDSVALYYACLAGHLDAARTLLENGAICSENTFDGDRCHYAALNLSVRRLLKAFEARPPPLDPLQASLRDTFLGCMYRFFPISFHSILLYRLMLGLNIIIKFKLVSFSSNYLGSIYFFIQFVSLIFKINSFFFLENVYAGSLISCRFELVQFLTIWMEQAN